MVRNYTLNVGNSYENYPKYGVCLGVRNSNNIIGLLN